MGVQGLWPLLEPVGRRIKIEALANKTLAVDASVWLFQFIKAMRDERGELIKNAHLLGFFRRICRLLFHKIRPVFVFDGATPALKKRTTIARRRRREQQDTKLRKTAEKLLLNQLKQHALEQVQQVRGVPKHVRGGSARGGRGTKRQRQGRQQEQEDLDSGVIAEVQTEAGQGIAAAAQPSVARTSVDAAEATSLGAATAAAWSTDDEMPGTSACHAACGASGQAAAGTGSLGASAGTAAVDVMLAAQLNAEELEHLGAPDDGPAPAAAGEVVDLGGRSEDEEGGEDEEEEEGEEELALEVMVPQDGELDPEVLSTLPPSLQLDIIMRVREQRVTLNREKFEARSGVPASFSEFQLQQYLKASALRRQVEQVRSAVNAAAAGGEAARRIAAEAGREYVLQKEQPAGSQAQQPQQQHQQQQSPGLHQGLPATQPATTTLQAEELAPLDISFEIPEVALSAGEGGGGDGSDDLEWEDVGGETDGAAAAASGDANGTADLVKLHWRERAAQRQRYWSLSHGFQRGRALADWGKEEEPMARQELGLDGIVEVGEDDEEFQRAIQLSLAEQRRPQLPHEEQLSPEQSEGEEIWEEVCQEDGVQVGKEPAQHLQQHSQQQPQQQQEARDPGLRHHQQRHVQWKLEEQPHMLRAKQQQQPQPQEQADRGQAGAERPVHSPAQPPPQLDPSSVPMATAAPARTAGMPASTAAAALPAPHPTRQPAVANVSLSPVPSVAAVSPAASLVVEFAETAKPGVAAAATLLTSWGASDAPLPAAGQDPGARPDAAQIAASSAANGHEAPFSASRGALPTLGVAGSLDNLQSAVPLASHGPVGHTAVRPEGTSFQDGPAALVVALPATLPASDSGSEPALENFGPSQPPPPRDLGITPPEQPLAQPAPELPSVQPSAQERPREPSLGQPAVQLALQPGPDFSFVNPTADIGTQLSELQHEERRLREAHRAHRGQSDAPTSEMYAECQELLQMFGIPYIIAPMEAESQCAWMDATGLVDGVVTDDNDVFLFGGQRIYRNIFQSNKYVEEFHFKDIERELGLTREKLTYLALLLGSDYTPGIAGVGIVNAVEVVNSFPTFDDLKLFKKWVDSPADDLLELLQDGSRLGVGAPAAFCTAHKSVRKNWDVPDNFPDAAVIEAYLNPKLDAARDKFTFGRPDLELLRSFCNECFDWTTDKADELLLPVLSAYDARQAQLTIDSFLSHRERFAKIKSKRLQKALGSIKPGLNKDVLFEQAAQDVDGGAADKPKPVEGKGKKRRKKEGP